MAVTVGVDSYISSADATAYHAARNNTAWSAASSVEQDSALLEATAYMDGSFEWIGQHPGSALQLLGWPRNNAVDHEGRTITGIPAKVAAACAELALLALSGDLAPASDRGGAVRREKVGEIEIEYEPGAQAGRSFTFAELLLKGLGAASGASGISKRLVRA